MGYKEKARYEAVRKLEKTTGTVVCVVLSAFFLLALFPIKVSGSGAGTAEMKNYHDLEMCFLDVLDMRLRECGYPDAGLTLNSIIYADGSRCYYVGIHHAQISDAGPELWEELQPRIADISFPIENCSIIYEIIF